MMGTPRCASVVQTTFCARLNYLGTEALFRACSYRSGPYRQIPSASLDALFSTVVFDSAAIEVYESYFDRFSASSSQERRAQDTRGVYFLSCYGASSEVSQLKLASGLWLVDVVH
jgi:hypothetical protein